MKLFMLMTGVTDQTEAVLKQALQDFKALRVIRHQQSCGQSTAIYTGVKAANYPWIATLDGDGQNDPADIPRLYEVLIREKETKRNLWMVAGWRNKRYDSRGGFFHPKWLMASVLVYWVIIRRIPVAA